MVARAAFSWLNDISRKFLAKDYLLPGVSPEQRVGAIGATAERVLNRPGFASKFVDYMSRGWYSLASPIWTNFGLDRGLPISCFGSCIAEDSLRAIFETHTEVGMMSKYGGGTSVYMNPLRPRGSEIKDNGKSSGSVHFAQLFDLEIRVVSQGSSRRGQAAVYWRIDHPDIADVLKIRSHGNPIQDLSYGVCVPDDWLKEMIAGDTAKRDIWAEVIKARKKTGYPYIIFIDTANRAAPKEYAKLGKKINHSNLCTEIFLSNDKDESFVCCLSSMNDLHYDEWKSTDAVETMVYFLDSVMSEFITKARHLYGMGRAVKFAENQRALGLGQLGWHSALQSRMVPFESTEAKRLNVEIARTIHTQAYAASARMANEYGEPNDLKGSGRRHMTLLAIAPTQSSSAILGQVSETVEPQAANIAIKDKQKLKYTYRNPYLGKLLEERGLDTPSVTDSILKSGGSVQHIDGLDAHEKDVFKTFLEISPMEIITQAAQRQPYVCQGQSINLKLDPELSARDTNRLYLAAWEMGVKSLYYQKNENAAQQLSRDILSCASCEG